MLTRYLEIGLVIASIAFLFLIIEIVLRLFFPVYLAGYIGVYQYDKELGFRLKDDIHVLKTTDYQQEILTNKLGTVNFQNNFDGYQMLIFAVGDSFTQGTGLPADASYPFQLDLLLNVEAGRYTHKYGVVNLGLAAFGGEQNLLALQRYAKTLGKPKFILYLGCQNDYEDNLLFRSGYSHKHLVAGNPYWGWYLEPLMWLTNETEIGKRVKIAVSSLRRQRIFSHDEKIAETGTGEKSQGCVAELEAPVFRRLIKISQEQEARLIVSWTDPPDGTDGSYRWLQEFARANGIAFADWYPAVNSVRQNIPGLAVNNPHSGGHYRTWVNGQIARAFAKQIDSDLNSGGLQADARP